MVFLSIMQTITGTTRLGVNVTCCELVPVWPAIPQGVIFQHSQLRIVSLEIDVRVSEAVDEFCSVVLCELLSEENTAQENMHVGVGCLMSQLLIVTQQVQRNGHVPTVVPFPTADLWPTDYYDLWEYRLLSPVQHPHNTFRTVPGLC